MAEPRIDVTKQPVETDPEIDLRIIQEGRNLAYRFEAPWGFLDATFEPIKGWFGIENFATDTPRQGQGKRLLRAALFQAQIAPVTKVHGLISSREALEDAKIVFGDEAVRVRCEGVFNDDYASLAPELGITALTFAHLDYRIDTT